MVTIQKQQDLLDELAKTSRCEYIYEWHKRTLSIMKSKLADLK